MTPAELAAQPDNVCRRQGIRVRVKEQYGRRAYQIERRRLGIWWPAGCRATESRAINDANLLADALERKGGIVWPPP